MSIIRKGEEAEASDSEVAAALSGSIESHDPSEFAH
jgi:hypothetical protein